MITVFEIVNVKAGRVMKFESDKYQFHRKRFDTYLFFNSTNLSILIIVFFFFIS